MALPLLKVHTSRRYLVTEDGKPFFWLGDTAWELFHRLGREEAGVYLRDRAGKGFTVIQAVVLAELDGLNTPNPAGHRPLIENDPTQPNEPHFQDVDWVVDRAEALGLYIGMLPTWATSGTRTADAARWCSRRKTRWSMGAIWANATAISRLSGFSAAISLSVTMKSAASSKRWRTACARATRAAT